MEQTQRLLLVDDDPMVLRLLSKILAGAYPVDTAKNAAAARALLAGQPYNLMLTDIRMPGESGADLIRFARSAYPHTAIVVVSGVSETDEAKIILDAGVYGYIVKPFEASQIKIAVENALRRRKLELRQEMDQKTLQAAVDAKTAELKKAHKAMVELLSSITSIFIGLSADMTIMQWNRKAEKVFQLKAEQVLNKRLYDAAIPWDRDAVRAAVEACVAGRRPVDLDTIIIQRPDGKNGFLGLRMTATESDPGKPTGILIMGADTTERKILESQLAQAQKLESIGQLAAGIAHEINTPIQYVGDNIRFMKDAFESFLQIIRMYEAVISSAKSGAWSDALIQDAEEQVQVSDFDYFAEEVPKAVEQTLEGVARIGKIVRSMKEFSHPGGDEMTSVDLNQALESTISVSRNEWKYVAEMETAFDSTLPLVSCFPGELNQVFLNIIINAAHAIESALKSSAADKGCIRVTTRSSGDAVEIRISDTGTGIPEDIRHRIFDPFFTTKDVGKGTGQGLAIAHRIVTEKHHGAIRVETETGRGSTFIIEIPFRGQEDLRHPS